MFEIGIFCVILFALGYWATLFIMGRRGDVLHGEFVAGESEPTAAPEAPPMPFPGVKPASHPIPVAPEPALAVASETLPAAKPVPARFATVGREPDRAVVFPPAPRPVIALPPANTERLQSLLVFIKQELKNASRM